MHAIKTLLTTCETLRESLDNTFMHAAKSLLTSHSSASNALLTVIYVFR